jgi:hypothetical protein
MSGTKMLKDMTGKIFGRLTVLRLAEVYDKREGAYWICRCECDGKERQVKGYFLRSGKTRSCGCLHNEEASILHSGCPGQAAFTQCFNAYKHNATKERYAYKRTLSFELSPEQFRSITQKNCFYCGAPPSQIQTVPSGNGDYIYNGIDRVDSSKGYVIENCVPCCGVHNRMKLDMPAEEFISACRSVVNHLDARG